VKFKKISMENFRPYYGRNDLNFKLTDENNILIVLRDNGHGKTSLLKAITWVFYGSSPRERFGLFNREARKEKGAEVKVEIGFRHEGHNYRIIRCLTPSKYPVKTGTTIQEDVSLYRDSTCIDKDELVAKELNEILPLEASQFFFFDGERIIEYTDPANWEQIQQAIECVLGIPTIRRAVDDLKEVKSELDLDYSEHLEAGKESKDFGEELSGYLKTQGELETDKKKAQDEAKILIEQLRDLEVNFRQYSSMVDLMGECESLEEEQKDIESNLKALDDQKLELSDGLYLAVLSGQLSALGSQLSKQREQMENEREAALKNLGRLEILESLKNRSMCYCGRKLDQDSIAMIESVIQGLNSAKTFGSSVGQISYIMSPVLYADKVRSLSRSASEKLVELGVLENGIFTQKSDNTEIKSLITSKTEKIHEDARERAPVIAADLEEIKTKLADEDSKVVFYKGQQTQVDDNISKIKKKIQKSAHSTPQQDLFERAVELAENARNAFIDIVSWMSDDKRQEIESLATEVHHSITNKPDVWKGIKIHDDFKMDIIDRRGKPVPKKELSAGEKQVLAFSFISALARAAKADTPIVMDSPIIRLDKEHRIKFLDYLPNLASQVALLMIPDIEMREDYYNLPSLKKHLGMLVEIEYDNEHERSAFKVI